MRKSYIIYKIKELDKAILRSIKSPTGEFRNKLKINNKSTPTQMKVLGYMIENYGKDIYQKDLEEQLDLSRATISDVLHRMEKNGLITRSTNPFDVRSKKINLTSSANKVFETGIERLENIEKNAIKNISEEELKTFVDVIDKMINNIYGERK